MTIIIRRASDWNFERIEVCDTLEEALKNLVSEFGCSRFVVDTNPTAEGCAMEITIYDYWIE